MKGYLIRRLLLIIPTIFISTLIVFIIARSIPGSAVELMATEMETEGMISGGVSVDVDYLRAKLGLDVPMHIQYFRWISAIVTRGDFGASLWTGIPLSEEFGLRYPVTFELSLMSMIISILVAVPIGVYSAIRQDTASDYLGRTFAIVGLSIPNFWVATMIVIFPAIWWGWAPPIEYIPITKNFFGNIGQFLIPATIMGISASAGLMRMTRTLMLEVLRNDYIRTAWSKGLTEKTVVLRHAFRNVSLPLITMLGARIPGLLGGAVIMEQIFGLPGIGRLMVEAINDRDYPIISGVNLIMAAFTLVVILITDISYAYLDPRMKYK